MLRKSQKSVYRRPRIVSEKIFEQAALACSGQDMGTPAVQFRNSLKNNINICEFAHS